MIFPKLYSLLVAEQELELKSSHPPSTQSIVRQDEGAQAVGNSCMSSGRYEFELSEEPTVCNTIEHWQTFQSGQEIEMEIIKAPGINTERWQGYGESLEDGN